MFDYRTPSKRNCVRLRLINRTFVSVQLVSLGSFQFVLHSTGYTNFDCLLSGVTDFSRNKVL